jgi:hypothetical protein
MERIGMQEYFGEVRAFFAPVARQTETASVFDPSVGFNVSTPAAPWIPLGRVRNLKRSAKATLGTVRGGSTGVAQGQFRKQVDARVSLDFCEWGKLQMALAAGSQQMNVLESAATSARGSGGAAKTAVALQTGSTASVLLLDSAVLGSYQVGELVVADVDFATGMTALGTGITGGVVAATAQLDCDAVRRVSYNVGAVAAVTATGLQLDAPLLGGAPAAGAKLQKVVGYVDREGASFVQEWSALFVLEAASGGTLYLHYPRLQAAAAAEEAVVGLGQGVSQAMLHAEFAAMAVVDGNDGENVVCYRSYVPAAATAAY